MKISDLYYESIKAKDVFGRYVDHHHLDSFLKYQHPNWSISTEGNSVEEKSIFSLTFGQGQRRILMWSQMHGNETTTTKALFDLVNSLDTDSELTESLRKNATIKIIPMLNPDGANRYTRVNANEIDLNRDAQNLSQPESHILKRVYKEFNPDYCFNLHDQRTIYSAGDTRQPATLSFSSPAVDKERNLSPERVRSMKLIAAIHKELLPLLGPQMARYDDSYNIDCVGDTFQSCGTPTLLFEAGHFPGDYQREETRKYMWYAILIALRTIVGDSLDNYSIEEYTSIPSNQKKYFDILIRNAEGLGSDYKPGESVGILYQEKLRDRRIEFQPLVEEIGELSDRFGHVEYDCRLERDLQTLKTDQLLSSLLFR
ncbi:MAG: M14 family zinc carboxypeptidase [Flavobacteriaceae bacterium]